MRSDLVRRIDTFITTAEHANRPLTMWEYTHLRLALAWLGEGVYQRGQREILAAEGQPDPAAGNLDLFFPLPTASYFRRQLARLMESGS